MNYWSFAWGEHGDGARGIGQPLPRIPDRHPNIDGLHQAAGNQRVSELHGSVWQFASPRRVDYTEDEDFSDDFRGFLSGDNREDLLRKWSEENNYDI